MFAIKSYNGKNYDNIIASMAAFVLYESGETTKSLCFPLNPNLNEKADSAAGYNRYKELENCRQTSVVVASMMMARQDGVKRGSMQTI